MQVFPLLPMFYRYHIKVDKTSVDFGYTTSFTSKKLDLDEIESAEVVEISPIGNV